ncbi:DegT/DnrJ/EryC1/StrS family aminotransferase [Deltaproteobacteria bacterium]|nr:DegT/DnrJ/EryC1/StrS family aminotransferase [Deltaproteobacteria bacterium]
MSNPLANIPVLDLTDEIDYLWDDINSAIQRVLKSKQFIMGKEVEAFEQEVSAYLGVRHAIGVNSGTDALVIGLRALGIGPGDEVITSPFTFFATAEAISIVGAKPVFVDIDPQTYNIDPSLVVEKITDRTRAIIPIHLFGQSADMDALKRVAAEYNLTIVEDVAQAFSGEYKGEKAGTLGDVGAYSFFPSKNLGCYGDGGLVVTNDDATAEQAKMLRVHGAKKKYYNEVIGYNSRLDSIQAAILRVKLPHIDRWSAGRKRVASLYNELLADLDGVVTPFEASDVKHVYHQYTIRVLNGRRDEVQEKLNSVGVGSMIYYPVPVHKLPVYASSDESHTVSECAASEVLSLPIWPQAEESVVERVVSELKKIVL